VESAAAGETTMRKSCGKGQACTLGLLASLVGGALAPPALAAAALPVFSPTTQTAWVGIGIGAFLPVPGWPSPVVQDPAYPYVSQDQASATGGQPTQRVGDINNPNLKQWAKDLMKKANDEVLGGKFAFTARTSCQPGGVPGFDVLLSGALFILQSPREVTMVFDGNAETRHIALNVPHAKTLKPSWYGDSVGHYEGDTLVIDTVGLNDKTFLDNWRTPHTDKLHVTERWRMIDNAAKMSVLITIEDPGTFKEPFKVLREYKRVNRIFLERRCSENNRDAFITGTPVAEKPDF
jgi:hypothetical protein